MGEPPPFFYEYFFLPSLSVAGAQLVLLREGEAAVTIGETAADEVAPDVIRALAAHVSLGSKRQLELADGVLLATYVCACVCSKVSFVCSKVRANSPTACCCPPEVCVVKVYTHARGVNVDTPTLA